MHLSKKRRHNWGSWLSTTVAAGDTCNLILNWFSTEDDIPTGNGTMKITVGGSVKAVLDVAQGDVTLNVSPYLATGSNIVKITVSDVYGNSRTINFTISVVTLNISSSLDSSIPYFSAITFPYIPVGNVSKTVHFIQYKNWYYFASHQTFHAAILSSS